MLVLYTYHSKHSLKKCSLGYCVLWYPHGILQHFFHMNAGSVLYPSHTVMSSQRAAFDVVLSELFLLLRSSIIYVLFELLIFSQHSLTVWRMSNPTNSDVLVLVSHSVKDKFVSVTDKSHWNVFNLLLFVDSPVFSFSVFIFNERRDSSDTGYFICNEKTFVQSSIHQIS